MKTLELVLKYDLNYEQQDLLRRLMNLVGIVNIELLERFILSMKNEETVHVLYEGEYSGMQTIGVFTDDHKEKLNRLVEQQDCEYSTESFKLNNRIDNINKALTFINNGYKTYVVYMRENGDSIVESDYSQDPVEDLNHGDKNYDPRCEWFEKKERFYPYLFNSDDSSNFKNSLLQDEHVLYCTIWAKSKEEAVKIVNEKRIQYIATNTWANKEQTADF